LKFGLSESEVEVASKSDRGMSWKKKIEKRLKRRVNRKGADLKTESVKGKKPEGVLAMERKIEKGAKKALQKVRNTWVTQVANWKEKVSG